MVLLGTGMGFTSAPATEAIMGVVPRAKAGVGSAVNDATRLLGGTLGVAVIGSVYASLYTSRLTGGSPRLAPQAARTAHDSVGAALELGNRAASPASPRSDMHNAATSGLLRRLQHRQLVAAGVGAAGAIATLLLLPAHPGPDPSAPAAGATVPIDGRVALGEET